MIICCSLLILSSEIMALPVANPIDFSGNDFNFSGDDFNFGLEPAEPERGLTPPAEFVMTPELHDKLLDAIQNHRTGSTPGCLLDAMADVVNGAQAASAPTRCVFP